MLSARAVAAIERLFERSIVENVDPQRLGGCRVLRDESIESGGPDEARRLVAVGISSYLFRIVALFDFGTDPATLDHLLDPSKAQAPGGQMLDDACAELANMICGSVNRTLAQSFRHSGMSTPAFLESGCSQFVGMLRPELRRSFAVSTAGGMRFQLTVASSAYGSVDFDLDDEAPEDHCAGELELF
jgi:hypothetical protein